MKKNLSTQRVVTFLTKEELEFLDKVKRDVMFSTGKYISRSQIIEDMAGLLARTQMSAEGVKNNEELRQRMLQAMIRINQANEIK